MRRAAKRDVVPAERVADDVDAEPVERCEALLERSRLRRPDLEPGVVLDAVLRLPGRGCCRRSRRQRDECRSDDKAGPHGSSFGVNHQILKRKLGSGSLELVYRTR